MTFLQSIFLYGLFSCSLPVLIHLFSRRKKEYISFSTLYFLKRLERKKIRRLKLRQMLLLLIRMIIIAMLVTAFARPTIVDSFSARNSNENPISAVIILDNSLSTSAVIDGSSYFTVIKQQALQALNTLKDGDEMFLLSAADPVDTKPYRPVYEVDVIRRRIQAVETSFRMAYLEDVLHRGIEFLESSTNFFREVYLISDFQSTNFNTEFTITAPTDVSLPIKIFCISPAERIYNNIGITDVSIENQILEKGKELTLQAVIKNYGIDRVHETIASLYLDGQRVAQQNFNLNPKESEHINFNVVSDKTGTIEGMVELEDDALSGDNRWYFTIKIPETIRILLVDGNPEAQVFLQSVFDSPIPGPIEIHTIDLKELPTIDFSDFDVIIINGFSVFSASEIYRLRNYCSNGGGLIIFPSAETDTTAFNQTIGREFSLPAVRGFSGAIHDPDNTEQDFLQVDFIDFDHPVFSNIFLNEQPKFDRPQIYYSLDVTPDENSRNIMMLSNNKPLLVETRFNDGLIYLFSSAAAVSWNTFPVQGIFAPFMYRLVQYLAGVHSRDSDYFVGDNIILHFSGTNEAVNMLTPDGDTFDIIPTAAFDGLRIEFSRTDFPGIYACRQMENVQRKCAVNIDPRESDIETLSDDRLINLFGENNIELLRNEQNLSDKIRESRTGREIGKFCVIAVVIFLVLETILQYERQIREPDDFIKL